MRSESSRRMRRLSRSSPTLMAPRAMYYTRQISRATIFCRIVASWDSVSNFRDVRRSSRVKLPILADLAGHRYIKRTVVAKFPVVDRASSGAKALRPQAGRVPIKSKRIKPHWAGSLA